MKVAIQNRKCRKWSNPNHSEAEIKAANLKLEEIQKGVQADPVKKAELQKNLSDALDRGMVDGFVVESTYCGLPANYAAEHDGWVGGHWNFDEEVMK